MPNKHPLFTLREMEERARALAQPLVTDAASRRWVGLLARIGAERLLIASTEIREVFSYRRHPRPSPVPGAKAWLKGLASLRGELLSIVDLGEYLRHLPCQTGDGARVIVTKPAGVRAGLLVDEVLGLRQFLGGDRLPAPAGIPWADGAFVVAEEACPVLSIQKLALNPEFRNAANG